MTEGDQVESKQLQYRSHGEKNHGGRPRELNVKTPKVVERHENVDKLERCIFSLYRNYISKCPQNCKRDDKDYKLEVASHNPCCK